MRKSIYIGVGSVIALGLIGALVAKLTLSKSETPLVRNVAVIRPVLTIVTEPEIRKFIADKVASKNPKVQDQVGVARLRVGYLAAKKKDWTAARQTFQTAARKYKGTGAMSADFGGLPDQAAYQATVCLVADGKEALAKAEFIRFMKERPLSPLVHACYKRLVRMNGGEPTPEADRLLQNAVTLQQKLIRFENSVCGPKTIAYLLDQNLLKGPKTDYKRLAKLCGTTDSGTTLEGMRKGLQKIGLESYAYRLNRQDLSRTSLPAILLEEGHYLAVLKVTETEAIVYDTRLRAEQTLKLPALDDPDFNVSVLLFSPLELAS